MKIAVCADGRELGSKVSPVFGRCPCFVIVESDEGEIKSFEAIENSAMDEIGGAGTAAAQVVGDKDVEAVISGGIGPKAFLALKQWEIDVFEAEPGTVELNVNKLLSGDLSLVENPTRSTGAGSAEEN